MEAMLIHWLVAAITVVLTAMLVPGFTVNNFFSALLAALVIGVVNMFVWPVLVFLTLPLTVVTFGLFLFIVNGLALKIAAAFTPGFDIRGFFPAVLGSIVLTLVGYLVRYVFYHGPSV